MNTAATQRTTWARSGAYVLAALLAVPAFLNVAAAAFYLAPHPHGDPSARLRPSGYAGIDYLQLALLVLGPLLVARPLARFAQGRKRRWLLLAVISAGAAAAVVPVYFFLHQEFSPKPLRHASSVEEVPIERSD